MIIRPRDILAVESNYVPHRHSEEECLEYHLSLAALPDGGEIARASPIL